MDELARLDCRPAVYQYLAEFDPAFRLGAGRRETKFAHRYVQSIFGHASLTFLIVCIWSSKNRSTDAVISPSRLVWSESTSSKSTTEPIRPSIRSRSAGTPSIESSKTIPSPSDGDPAF